MRPWSVAVVGERMQRLNLGRMHDCGCRRPLAGVRAAAGAAPDRDGRHANARLSAAARGGAGSGAKERATTGLGAVKHYRVTRGIVAIYARLRVTVMLQVYRSCPLAPDGMTVKPGGITKSLTLMCTVTLGDLNALARTMAQPSAIPSHCGV